MKKIILITGWTWYIWAHWVVAFEQAWFKTIIVDNLSNSSYESLEWIKKILWYYPDFFETDLREDYFVKNIWEKLSIRDWEKIKWTLTLKQIFEEYNFDWVVHFAGLKAVWESCQNPLKYFDNNINWSIKLFELMEKYSVKNILFSSSATVYNSSNYSPSKIWKWVWVDENWQVWKTTNPYWNTKFLLEKILEDLSKFSWFNVINLRYFNPIWAHKSWFIWEKPNWIPNNLLPFILKVAKWELKNLQVFGWDYGTKDWTWVRDYIDVNDLIDGHLKAYNFLKNNKNNFETFNLWTWKWTSVLEILKIAEKVIWKNISYKIIKRREWDLAEVFCNPKKAENILNWKTKISLEESVKNSWKFYE